VDLDPLELLELLARQDRKELLVKEEQQGLAVLLVYTVQQEQD
jgi:hypothetical protein